MKSGHLYYASDKAVYDALVQYNFKNADMRELLLSRGILISQDTERKVLALYFSRMNHDYYDHQRIAGIFGGNSRKERVAISSLQGNIGDSKLEVAAQAFKEELESKGAKVSVKWVQKKMEITVLYDDYNSNKSEFKQTVEREGVFEIEVTESGLNVRGPQNNFMDNSKAILIDLLAKNSEGGSLGLKEIEMSSIHDNKLRTKFFRNLLANLNGYVLKDVTDVYVYNPKIKADSAEGDLGIHITKASLKGEGLLFSQELDGLLKTGFYVCKIVWTTHSASEKSDLYELEAQFTEPEHCEKFSYAVKGRYKLGDSGHHNKNKTSCESLAEKRMLRLLEAAAMKTLDEVAEEFSGGKDETN